MKCKVLPHVLMYEGVLDENTSYSELLQTFEEYKKKSKQEIVTVDLSKVSRANSTGIVTWLRFISASKATFKYINVPKWLVGQFNMINGFLVNKSYVESLQVPFFSQENESVINFFYTIGKEIPILESYESFSLPNRIENGREYEMDANPEQYFSFISQNFQELKGK